MARVTVPDFGAYVATEHVVVGFSETLYQELSGTGVGVSVFCPGLTHTNIFESERKRPVDGEPTDHARFAEGARQSIAESPNTSKAGAACVVDAIQSDRMHILPNEEIRPVLEERFRPILTGENPLVMPMLAG